MSLGSRRSAVLVSLSSLSWARKAGTSSLSHPVAPTFPAYPKTANPTGVSD